MLQVRRVRGDETSVSGGLVGASAPLLGNAAMVRRLFNYPRLEALLEGRETRLDRLESRLKAEG